EGQEIDELAALIEPPEFDLVLPLALLTHPVHTLLRLVLIVDVRIIPAPQSHGVPLDDSEELRTVGYPVPLERVRPDRHTPMAPQSNLVKDSEFLSLAH